MISIIIPVYNRGKQIGACLESILNQSYKNYEVIIINDGSTDNTREVIDSYRERFGINLSLHDQSNQGPQVARNQGAKYSHGEFLLFCDGDIILNSRMLEKMHNALKSNPEAAVTMITSNKGISIAREEIEFAVCTYIMKNVTHSNELLNQFNKVIISPIKTNIVSPIKTSVTFPIQKVQNYYKTKNYVMLALITSISISILVAVGYLNSMIFH